jgi:hypothetical protein
MGGIHRASLRGAIAALMAAGALCVQWTAPATAMAALPGLTFVSASTWTADPEAGRVHVAVAVTATSHTVDQGPRSYYFPGMQLTVPASTLGFTATAADDRSLPVSILSSTVYGVVLEVSFEQRLYSGQSVSFELQFDLVDSGSSTDRDLRIDRDVMSFPVTAFGTQGTPGSSVSVAFPAGFTVQQDFGGLTRKADSSNRVVFVAGSLPDPTALNAWFTATRPVPAADFLERVVAVGRLQVTLRYWKDDPAWADQVERILQAGYPVMSQMIGLGDPVNPAITIQEATSQSIAGFSGQYNQTSGQVEVSYFADPFVLLHEIAHLWFNANLATDRWIDEGFASYYAEQTILQLGMPDHAPQLTDRLAPARMPLNDWVGPDEPDSLSTSFLYAASIELAKETEALAGLDGLRRVWVEIRAGLSPYQPASGLAVKSLTSPGVDWRGLLDYLEQATGKSFESIWRQWVVDPSQVADLTLRDQARNDYAGAVVAAGSWSLPPDLRQAMESWQFLRVEGLIADVKTALLDSQQIAVLAPLQGTTPPATVRAAFEGKSAAAAVLEAGNELIALGSIAAARQARVDSQGAARAVGLLGADPEADLAAAQKAFSDGDPVKAKSLADGARSAWEGANSSGQARILGASALGAALLLFLLAMIVAPRRAAAVVPRPPAPRKPASSSG